MSEDLRAYFDEARVRALVARIVDRTSDMAASVTNHALAEEGEPSCRHGDAVAIGIGQGRAGGQEHPDDLELEVGSSGGSAPFHCPREAPNRTL